MSEFCMPSLGADMDAGTLVAWHVAPGARVKRGDVVADVETQKGIIEVEIWEAGVIDRLLIQPGAKVPVGTPLAMVRADAVGPAAGARPPVPATSPAVPAPVPPPVPAPDQVATPSSDGAHVRASPAARQLARERGVDLASVRGTGPHGAVTRGDIERAAMPVAPAVPVAAPAVPVATPAAPVAAAAAAPVPTTSASDGMRRAIAVAMARSKREIPHYYLSTEIDVHPAIAWLEAENGRREIGERLLFAPVLLKATALALREVPELNGFFTNEAFHGSDAIHVGVAIALRQGGLVAPAIHDVDRLSLTELMTALRDVVARARSGALRSSEMTDATITVTSLGDQGADAVFGVIYPPQVALVGFGTPRERPWAVDGLLGVRPVIVASLSADHRVSDGHRGARFLSAVARLLSDPEKL